MLTYEDVYDISKIHQIHHKAMVSSAEGSLHNGVRNFRPSEVKRANDATNTYTDKGKEVLSCC